MGKDSPAPPAGPALVAGLPGVSRETIERLETYVALLERWQPAINLVSSASLADVWRRHILDSLQLLALGPADAQAWLDLGSGAGLPGLVLAIALIDKPGARVRLVEADQRKAAFLAEAIRATGAPADVIADRAERLDPAPADVITARGLAPLPGLLALAHRFWAPQTRGLFLKGRMVERELVSARLDWQFDYDRVASRSDSAGAILVVRGLRRA